MPDDEEQLVTRHVLKRKKNQRENRETYSVHHNVPKIRQQCLTSNLVVNWVLLLVPVGAVLGRYHDVLFWQEWVWILMSIFASLNRPVESLLLPIITSGACGGPELLRLNLGMSLAYSFKGAICGSAIVWPYPFPLLTFGLKRFLQHIIKESLPEAETFLISVILMNAGYGAINGHPALVMFACGLIGLLPCYPFVKMIANKWRTYHRLDRKASLIAKLSYFVYFLVSGMSYYLYISSHEGIFWLVEQIEANATLVARWGLILCVAFFTAWLWGPYLGLDGRRKLWHLTSVLLFLPKSARVPFTQLALAAMLVAFIDLEIVRSAALPPLGILIHEALRGFIDHRDVKGPVVISHLYLLLGITFPMIAGNGNPAGLICLGLGDTLASLIGRNFGNFRIFGKKSVEGTMAFIIVTTIALKYCGNFTWMSTLFVCFPSALIEAVSPLNDNLILPPYMMALMCLVQVKTK